MAEVTLEHVSKVYPTGVHAVQDLNLHISDGELVVLVGPSGCGKTTTLRLIAGLETLSAGTIRIGDSVVNDLPPRRRDVAMVFQRSTLYPHMTARRNLAFGLQLRHSVAWFGGGTTPEIDKRVEDIAHLLQLEELLDRKPQQLSGGQQQRVALGRALVRRPAVFLLDEPLSHLDSRLRSEMRRELHLLHRRIPATMIYVTHDPSEAMTLADRVVVLDGGVVQQVDRPQEVYDRPSNRRVAGFFGWPPMNLLDGVICEETDGPRFTNAEGSLTVWLPNECRSLGSRSATLGIRPEDVGLLTAAATIEENGPAQGPPLDMEVALVEPLGSASLVSLRRGGLRLTAVTESGRVGSEGQKMNVVLRMERAHLFDGVSGEALRHDCRTG
jgi:multiple sugar transport system ATP-binding protein